MTVDPTDPYTLQIALDVANIPLPFMIPGPDMSPRCKRQATGEQPKGGQPSSKQPHQSQPKETPKRTPCPQHGRKPQHSSAAGTCLRSRQLMQHQAHKAAKTQLWSWCYTGWPMHSKGWKGTPQIWCQQMCVSTADDYNSNTQNERQNYRAAQQVQTPRNVGTKWWKQGTSSKSKPGMEENRRVMLTHVRIMTPHLVSTTTFLTPATIRIPHSCGHRVSSV